MQVLWPDGGFFAQFRGESGLSKWAKGYFISDQDELEEREKADMEPPLDPLRSGSPGNESASVEKLFWGPTSVKVDAQNRVYVVDSLRHRIQIYRKES